MAATTLVRTNASSATFSADSIQQKKTLKETILNNSSYVQNTFPEFHSKTLTLVTAPVQNIDTAVRFEEANLETMLSADGLSNIRNVKQHLAEKGITNPRILSFIDFQKDFLNGGSLMVPGAQEKVLAAFKEMLEENKKRIDQGLEPLFDLIIMTKDFHPVNHSSFTRNSFGFEEITEDAEGNERKGFKLTPNREDVTMRNFWQGLPHIAALFDFEEDDANPNGMTLFPKDEARYDELKQSVEKGALMPFSTGFHPIPVTPHMFRKVEGITPGDAFSALRTAGVLTSVNGQTVIDREYTVNGVAFKNAFSCPGFASEFNQKFVEGLCSQIFRQANEENLNKTRQMLSALFENFWPDHSVKGTSGHQFHPEIVALLEANCPDTPLIALPKGASTKLGESYSAGLNTAGYMATPYLKLLQFFEAKENIVCGTATGYCPSGSAFDSQAIGIKTSYWVGASKGIIPQDEESAQCALRAAGVKVTNTFPGLCEEPQVGIDEVFFAPAVANQTYTPNKISSTGKYQVVVAAGAEPLSLAKAEQAARHLSVFLKSAYATDVYHTDQEMANLVSHVAVIDDVIGKYNDSVNNSGLIAFFTVVLLVLTLGMYNLRKDLIHNTAISNVIPKEYREAAKRIADAKAEAAAKAAAKAAAEKELAEVKQLRQNAHELLEEQEALDEDEQILLALLSQGEPILPKTKALEEAYTQNKLDTIKKLNSIVVAEDTANGRLLSNNPRDLLISQEEIEELLTSTQQLKQTLVLEVELTDGTKVTFGPEEKEGVLSLELLGFAIDKEINAKCAQAVEKYKKNEKQQ